MKAQLVNDDGDVVDEKELSDEPYYRITDAKDRKITELHNQTHGIDRLYFEAPYIVTDVESTASINDFDTDELEEETSQGYHRRVAFVECECGERFDGRTALSDYRNHE